MVWKIARFIHWFAVGVCVLAATNEVLRLVYDGKALVARLRAFGTGILPEYDRPYVHCDLYLVPSTTLPVHPAGIVWGTLFHCFNVIFLLAVIGDLAPIASIIKKWHDWFVPFNADHSIWYAGALMVEIGASFLGYPTGIVGDVSAGIMRFVTGWLLVGTGTLCIVLGMTVKEEIRFRVGQCAKPKDPPDPGAAVKTNWRGWRTTIFTCYADHVAVGPLRDALDGMDKQVGDL